jgi:hypothetical protein
MAVSVTTFLTFECPLQRLFSGRAELNIPLECGRYLKLLPSRYIFAFFRGDKVSTGWMKLYIPYIMAWWLTTGVYSPAYWQATRTVTLALDLSPGTAGMLQNDPRLSLRLNLCLDSETSDHQNGPPIKTD